MNLNLSEEQKQQIKEVILKHYLPGGLTNTAFRLVEDITGEEVSMEDRYKYTSLSPIDITDNTQKNSLEIKRFKELKDWVEKNEDSINRGIVIKMKS